MNLNEQVQRLLDLDAIRDLPRRYAHCVWCKDAAGTAALFTEDGVMDTGTEAPMRGRAAIAATYTPIFAGGELQPFVHNHVIALDGDTATGTAYLDLRATVGGRNLIGTGIYHDVYVRAAGGWLFQSRKLIMQHMVPFGEAAQVSLTDVQHESLKQ